MSIFNKDILGYYIDSLGDDDDREFLDGQGEHLDIEMHLHGRLSEELTAYLESEMKGMSLRERTYFVKGLLLPFRAIREALAERNEEVGVSEPVDFELNTETTEGWFLAALSLTKKSIETASTTAGFEHLI